jgi:MSHA biogenesis protein MshE
LRQDPDIIMVGEMRDAETVEIGVSAAMTGHLVLSTLHTNDTVSTATRLLDMGVEGYLLATTLRSIIAQRLVRKVCTYCAKPYTPDPFEAGWIRDQLKINPAQQQYSHGAGCMHCGFTGYQGRMGVYELLDMNSELAEALRRDDTQGFVEAAERAPGFKPLVNVAHDYAARGLTSIDEVLKLAGESREQLIEEEVLELDLEIDD